MLNRRYFAAAAVVLCTTAAFGQNTRYVIKELVLEDANIPTIGLISSIDNLAVNNGGVWLVEADTDNPDTDADTILIREGVIYLREGGALPEPPGATIGSFDSVNLNNAGNSGWNLFLDDTGGTSNDSGIYFNTQLLIQEGDDSTAPEWSLGTPYIGFFGAAINDAGDIVMVATADDEEILSTADRGLVLLDLDASGNLVQETVLAKETDFLAGQTETIADLGTSEHQLAFNAGGDVMFFADLNGDTNTDGVLYVNSTLITQEGDPAPAAGRLYQTLSSRAHDLNDHGRYVFKADLDGDTATDYALIRDGEIFRQEGDTLPAIAPYVFEGGSAFGISSGPVEIDQYGNVLYFGDWNDPNQGLDSGLFLNDTLLVQEGVTLTESGRMGSLYSGTDGFKMSDNGRFVVFEGTLVDGRNGAFLIEVVRCPDFDDSGAVDLSDLATFLAAFGLGIGDPGFDQELDLDFSGTLGLGDLALLLARFGQGCL